jgi:hypothetical protein
LRFVLRRVLRFGLIALRRRVDLRDPDARGVLHFLQLDLQVGFELLHLHLHPAA